MTSDTITFALEGEVNLDDLAAALPALKGLIDGLGSDVAPGAAVDWVIDGLSVGSAVLTARGESDNMTAVETIASAYLTVGQALERGGSIPYAPNIQRYAQGLVSLLNDRLTAVRFETADAEAIVHFEAQLVPTERPELLRAFGAVEGVVQTLSNRKGLRFTLYDTLFDKPVSCYLIEGQEGIMRDAWGRRALVEGVVSRDPITGRPISVREISHVELVRDVPPGSYRAARGILRFRPGDITAAEAIRQLRDA